MFLNITPQNRTSASASPLSGPDRHGERRYEAGTSGRDNGARLHWQSLPLFSVGRGWPWECVRACVHVHLLGERMGVCWRHHVLTAAEHRRDKAP